MSGKYYSSGLLTNKGSKDLNIKDYLNQKIMDINLHIFPLSTNIKFTTFQIIGTLLKTLTPMIVNPSLTHVAVQLNLERTKDVLLIEYGNYLTKDSDHKNGIFSSGSSSSSEESRKNTNDNIYYYINKDGVRITLFTYEKLKKCEDFGNTSITELISGLTASQYFNLSLTDYKKLEWNESGIFHVLDCDIKNKITVEELINNFKDKKWEAKEYNVLTHNCQTFATEVIKILKAIRRNEIDKIRIFEKTRLPGCLINALWHNEDLSLTNTLGRIPIFGFFHDIHAYNNTMKNIINQLNVEG
jgi:hypothetical protein